MRAFPLSLLLSLIGTAVPLTAFAENGKYFPIDHREIGAAARANVKINPGLYGYFQPIRVELPTTGEVTFFDGTLRRGSSSEAPAQAGMMVGHVYRVKIAHMPEFPNVELYPTLEIIDRLHPPPGLAARFPIPVNITVEEIETALHDQMVTKVIYLEQPDFAAAEDKLSDRVQVVPPNENLLATADRLGRPMAILRMGGRTPDPRAPQDDYYGDGAPVRLDLPTTPAESANPAAAIPMSRQPGIARTNSSTDIQRTAYESPAEDDIEQRGKSAGRVVRRADVPEAEESPVASPSFKKKPQKQAPMIRITPSPNYALPAKAN